MIWVECLRAYIHVLPVTKIQFEYFLCDCEESWCDSEFYLKMLGKNPRESAGQLTSENYCRAFATGISPDASQAFTRWLGEDRDERYDLPTKREWYAAYVELKVRSDIKVDDIVKLGLTDRVKNLFVRVNEAATRSFGSGPSRTLADMMLFKHGVYEWVLSENDQWRGAGIPHTSLKGSGAINVLEHEKPVEFNNIADPPPACGFRLLKRS
jgi:formylglycine-generating enzyme required for sulfatase activity